MKYKVFPKGYDPVVASGAPSALDLKVGSNWTPEETIAQKRLESEAVCQEHKPEPGRWYTEILGEVEQ